MSKKSAPRKIAHILPWPTIGGTEHATLRIAQAVAGDDFQNIAYCLRGAPPIKEMFAGAGLEVADYDATEPSFRRPAPFWRASSELARDFKERGVDLIHCADILAAKHTALAGRLARLPVVSHVRNRHDDVPGRERLFLHAVNKFIFVSRDTWRRFGYRVAPRRGVIVYDGIDEVQTPSDANEVRREFGIPDSSKVIGMVARVAPQKDYRTLARAARRVIDVYPDVRFLIVGDYTGSELYRDFYREVQRDLSDNGVASSFIFTGFRADVTRLIAVFDVFVLSTHWEGLPLVLLEAMAQSKPVVATAVDGIPELIAPGRTGLLYPHEDDERLAVHLLSLIGDERRAAALGAAGRNLLRTDFSREKFAQNTRSFYHQMFGDGRGMTTSLVGAHPTHN